MIRSLFLQCLTFSEMFQAKLIVENVHLHLLPSLNPDGFTLRKRGNANNIDLNRDFPDQVFFFYNVLYRIC